MNDEVSLSVRFVGTSRQLLYSVSGVYTVHVRKKVPLYFCI